jgi:hypothetical protein
MPRHSVMIAPAAERIFGLTLDSPSIKPAGMGFSGQPMYEYHFKVLAAGGVTISDPAIGIYRSSCDGKTHDGHICYGADLSLGLEELRKFHLYFANKERVLYITAANAGAGEPKKITP